MNKKEEPDHNKGKDDIQYLEIIKNQWNFLINKKIY